MPRHRNKEWKARREATRARSSDLSGDDWYDDDDMPMPSTLFAAAMFEAFMDHHFCHHHKADVRDNSLPVHKMSKEELFRDHYQNMEKYAKPESTKGFKGSLDTVSREPVSVASLQVLQRICLEDLEIDADQSGSYLLLRVIAKPFVVDETFLVSLVEEEEHANNLACPLVISFKEGTMTGDPNLVMPKFATIALQDPHVQLGINDVPFLDVKASDNSIVMIGSLSDAQKKTLAGGRLSIKAKEKVRSAAEQEKQSLKNLKDRANEFYQNGNHECALDSYSEALLGEKSAGLFSARAQVLLKLGRFAEALADCESALAVHKDHANATLRKATALCGLGRPDEAVDLLRAHPKSRRDGEFKAAISQCQRMISKKE